MSCRIELSSSNNFFLAGSVIIGKVVCVLNGQEDIDGITLKFEGLESVHWYSNKTSYSGKNKFLWDQKELAPAGRLGPGCLEYPFAFTLPSDIPSSYAYVYGMIIYTLEAKVHRPYKFDHKHKIVLHVTKPLDLNEIEDKSFLEPCIFDAEKTVCCWCLSSGHISMEVQLEKRAFVSDETVKILVRIRNDSNQNVKFVKAQLKSYVKAKVEGDCYGGSILHDTKIAEAKEEGFGPRSEKEYEILLRLPQVHSVPNFVNASFLRCTYRLMVTVGLPLLHLNLYSSVPVLFADVPVGGPENYPAWLKQVAALNVLSLIQEVARQQFATDNYVDRNTTSLDRESPDIPDISNGTLALLDDANRSIS